MHPVILKFGILTVYSYGVMIALGFGVATCLIYRSAARFGLDKTRIIDMAIVILVSGIIGARALYVLINIRYYLAAPLEIFNLSNGGLVWYGAFTFGVLSIIFFVKHYKMDFWTVGDLIVPYAALAQAFGRIGCFLNGCCYGIQTPDSYPFGIIFPGEEVLRHPTQIYSALGLILFYMILRLWQEHRRFAGEIFLGYALLYSVGRFSVEYLRGDNARLLSGLTMSQWMSAVVFVAAILIFGLRYRKWKMSNSNSK